MNCLEHSSHLFKNWIFLEQNCLDFELSTVVCLFDVEHDGFLLDVSQTKILFYFSNLKNEHSIKIINRETGILDGVINIPFDNVSKLIKFDSKSNILMKSYPDNILRLYNSTGEFLMSRTTIQFTDLDRFDLNSSDEIVCYDRRNNKICYF